MMLPRKVQSKFIAPGCPGKVTVGLMLDRVLIKKQKALAYATIDRLSGSKVAHGIMPK